MWPCWWGWLGDEAWSGGAGVWAQLLFRLGVSGADPREHQASSHAAVPASQPGGFILRPGVPQVLKPPWGQAGRELAGLGHGGARLFADANSEKPLFPVNTPAEAWLLLRDECEWGEIGRKPLFEALGATLAQGPLSILGEGRARTGSCMPFCVGFPEGIHRGFGEILQESESRRCFPFKKNNKSS